MDVLVIMDHFTWYTKAVVTPNQSAKVMMTAFWNEFIANYGFPEKLLTNQGHNFESQVVKELCKLAQIWKVWMTPYHPETNGQHKRFIQTLISMISILGDHSQAPLERLSSHTHAHIQLHQNNVTDFSPYYLMYRCRPRLPDDIWFGLTSPLSEEHSHKQFMAKLSSQLWWCYELANQNRCKESTCQKQWYDQKMRSSRLKPGDLCLVWQKALGWKHKIGDAGKTQSMWLMSNNQISTCTPLNPCRG